MAAQTVHPVPAPLPEPPGTKALPSSSRKAGGSSQKLMLFIRGKAMSGAPIISGTNPVAEPADHRRHHHEEHHDQAVGGDQHVPEMVGFIEAAAAAERRRPGLQVLHARLGQFPAHRAGNGAADDPGGDREDQIERADVLVVRRHEPADEETGGVVRVVRMMGLGSLEMDGVCSGVGHDWVAAFYCCWLWLVAGGVAAPALALASAGAAAAAPRPGQAGRGRRGGAARARHLPAVRADPCGELLGAGATSTAIGM